MGALPWIGSLLGLLAGLASCNQELLPPSWTPLAERFVESPSSGGKSVSHPWRDGRNLDVAVDRDWMTLRIPVERQDWEDMNGQDRWRAQLGLHLPRKKDGCRLRLETPAGLIKRRDILRLQAKSSVQGFAPFKGALMLSGVPAGPPEHATLVCELPRTAINEHGRFASSDFSGEGILVRAGSSASCTVDVPGQSALRFATLTDPLLVLGDEPPESVIRIRVDDSLVYEHRDRWQEHATPVWHRIPLPAEGRTGARLQFEVEGFLTSVAFLDPCIGPLEVGSPGERPWRETRPDIVLFVADTFRADNLATYGGLPGVTPNLDALAARSLCFKAARSAATWTLPSHASMFTGLYPLQVGTGSANARLPGSLETVAERLEDAGYRTAALTDGGYLSAAFGLGQGFALCSERTLLDLPGKLAEARDFLAADDGRPVFLFVHTYRVHWPYQTSDRTRRELGERLGIRGKASELLQEAFAEARRQGAASAAHFADLCGLSPTPRLTEIGSQLRAHYLGAVADLDRDFAGFVELFGSSGILDRGYLVFTSDHGEAFGEHGAFFHAGRPFEEQTRIPLLITGRSLRARNVDQPVSHLDLGPTLLEMAGLGKPPQWRGHSLLSPGPDGPVLSFQAAGGLPRPRREPGDALSVLEQEKKILCAHEDGAGVERGLLGAFDLAQDAKEEHDLSPGAGDWPRAMLARNAALLALALEPVVQGEAAELDDETEENLRALGY